jgi:hypothetical protein
VVVARELVEDAERGRRKLEHAEVYFSDLALPRDVLGRLGRLGALRRAGEGARVRDTMFTASTQLN